MTREEIQKVIDNGGHLFWTMSKYMDFPNRGYVGRRLFRPYKMEEDSILCDNGARLLRYDVREATPEEVEKYVNVAS